MKDKDRWFFEAVDMLEAAGVNVVAAAGWFDRDLTALGLGPDHLKAWRSVFYDPWGDRRLRPTKAAGQRQKGRAINVSLHIAHARRGH